MTAPRQSRTRAVLGGLVVGLSFGALALTLLAVAATIVVPRVAGAIPLTVLSGSMQPTLPVGSLAVVRPVDPADIQIGDVITVLPYADDSSAVTHRVRAIHHDQHGDRRFTLQGDANYSADEPVYDHQVRGRLWYTLPGLGTVNSFVNGEMRHVFVQASAGALFVYAAASWVRAYRGRRASHGAREVAT